MKNITRDIKYKVFKMLIKDKRLRVVAITDLIGDLKVEKVDIKRNEKVVIKNSIIVKSNIEYNDSVELTNNEMYNSSFIGCSMK